jgi:transcriptional regulatory protein RtcR
MMKNNVIFGVLGIQKDEGRKPTRWKHARPTVDICRYPDLPIHRYELFYQKKSKSLAKFVSTDIGDVSKAEVILHEINFNEEPWDFETVYNVLYDFAKNYPFDHEKERYLVNISAGTHVIQICLFLLTEAKYFPGTLIQCPGLTKSGELRQYIEIDLSLGRYDKIVQRRSREYKDDVAFLKDNIETRNLAFENLITKILRTSTNYEYPILLTGETGVGKTSLAFRIHDLRKKKHKTKGEFIAVNCGTLRGDTVHSMLFGHEKGAFTGADVSRDGFLKLADEGTLFLDEIGELELEVQKMLLTAIEDKEFRRLGGNTSIKSSFRLIAGTNSNLTERVNEGRFRKDFLARIDTFTFEMPALRNRIEDIEPNIKRELDTFSLDNNIHVTINQEALSQYLDFTRSSAALWTGNFRDLKSSVIRMAVNAEEGRITESVVADEVGILQNKWGKIHNHQFPILDKIIGAEKAKELDLSDCFQLEGVLGVCFSSRNRSEAGRRLYGNSRERRKSSNDADRLIKYLERFQLNWDTIKSAA